MTESGDAKHRKPDDEWWTELQQPGQPQAVADPTMVRAPSGPAPQYSTGSEQHAVGQAQPPAQPYAVQQADPTILRQPSSPAIPQQPGYPPVDPQQAGYQSGGPQQAGYPAGPQQPYPQGAPTQFQQSQPSIPQQSGYPQGAPTQFQQSQPSIPQSAYPDPAQQVPQQPGYPAPGQQFAQHPAYSAPAQQVPQPSAYSAPAQQVPQPSAYSAPAQQAQQPTYPDPAQQIPQQPTYPPGYQQIPGQPFTPGQPPLNQPPGHPQAPGGRGNGWLWALGAVVVTSAIWAGGVFAAGGFSDGPQISKDADLRGYHFVGNLCDATDTSLFTGRNLKTQSTDSSGKAFPTHEGHQHAALDTMSCGFHFAPPGSTDKYSYASLYVDATVHKQTNPGPEFDAYRDTYTDTEFGKDSTIEKVSGIGDAAYLRIKKPSSGSSGVDVSLSVRDGWFTYGLSWYQSDYGNKTSGQYPSESDIKDLLRKAAAASMPKLRG
ncbi:hypothetical protein [Nocardia arthritidis]|uniref:Uncharacterized protein n=1 Tax=Nocardia arthritidis TaxID=228602 RepID=A0A6G9YFQ9_9NOCA|nr:hypothetical protein [Nocardia arthritidis]QIS12059.1 hypothetical protein F5544_20980 [Nocardia arthritidis]